MYLKQARFVKRRVLLSSDTLPCYTWGGQDTSQSGTAFTAIENQNKVWNVK